YSKSVISDSCCTAIDSISMTRCDRGEKTEIRAKWGNCQLNIVGRESILWWAGLIALLIGATHFAPKMLGVFCGFRMRTLILNVFLTLSAASASAQTITPSEARSHIGEHVTVEGIVSEVHHAA